MSTASTIEGSEDVVRSKVVVSRMRVFDMGHGEDGERRWVFSCGFDCDCVGFRRGG